MKDEKWLETQYKGFSVSSFGRVRNDKTNYILSPPIDTYGYPKICIIVDGKIKNIRVHRLVALAFIGDPPDGKTQVAHNDGNPRNNLVSNLRWATNKENMQDKQRHGTQTRGSEHYLSKLTDESVRKIREYGEMGLKVSFMADALGVSETVIYCVLRGKTWKHVA
jgi:hypothetical protein